MKIEESKISRFLLDSRMITRRDLESALFETKNTNESITDYLVRAGTVTESGVRRAAAHVRGIPYVSLKKKSLPYEVLSHIPEAISREYHVVAFAEDQDSIEVAALDPDVLAKISSFLKKGMASRLVARVTDEESIRYALMRYQAYLAERYGGVITQESLLLQRGDEDEGAQSRERAGDRILVTILRHALSQKARAIHVIPSEGEYFVRYRIGSSLTTAMRITDSVARAIISRARHHAHLLGDASLPEEGTFHVKNVGIQEHFRVVTQQTQQGMSAVLYVHGAHVSGFTLEGIGMVGSALEAMQKTIQIDHGFICVAGPAGSGKTTFLYTLLDIFARDLRSVALIAETSETSIKGVQQIITKPAVGFGREDAIRATLKQDVDIIGVDAVDDPQVLDAVLSASWRVRAAVSTIESGGVVEALEGIRAKLGDDASHHIRRIKAVVGVALVRTLDPAARTKRYITNTELKRIREYAHVSKVLIVLKSDGIVAKNATWSSISFFEPTDPETGYISETGVFEILDINPERRHMLESGESAYDIYAAASRDGMCTLVEDALYKAVMGVTSLDEVFRLIDERY